MTESLFTLTKQQWEEVHSLLGFLGIGEELQPGDESALHRGHWIAIAQMALGKAQLIDEGRYNMGDEDDVNMPYWSYELRVIARTILDEFQPGDGKF